MAKKSTVAAEECCASGAPDGTIESFPNSNVLLGNLPVARALPVRRRRLVGPWCFLDRFGPLAFAEGKPMDVVPSLLRRLSCHRRSSRRTPQRGETQSENHVRNRFGRIRLRFSLRLAELPQNEIGRASCRERVYVLV